ncbi:Uncharacterised protein [Vibrio cholerae]|nr:Uncharacterised protein [Vibrio cholerae]
MVVGSRKCRQRDHYRRQRSTTLHADLLTREKLCRLR